MFKERLLETLKLSKKGNKSDKEMTEAMNKIQKHERLSSQEFCDVYDAIWKEGPKAEYRNPDNWKIPSDKV